MKKGFIYGILIFVFITLQFTVTFYASSAFVFNKIIIPSIFLFFVFLASTDKAMYTKEFILYLLLFVWSLFTVVVVVDTVWWWKYNQIMLGIILAHFILIRFFRMTDAMIPFNYGCIAASFYYFYDTFVIRDLRIIDLFIIQQKGNLFWADDVINPNTIGAIICVSFFTSFVVLYSKIHWFAKIIPAFYILLSIPLVAMTNSRSSLLSIIIFIALYFLFILTPKKPIISAVVIFILSIASLSIWETYLKDSQVGVKFETTGKSGADEDRLYVFETAWHLFLENPITGVGAGNFVKRNKTGLYTHNDFAELASTLGLVGLLLYYSMYYIIFRKLIRLHRFATSHIQKSKAKILLITMVVLLVLSNAIPFYPDMLFMSLIFCISLLATRELKYLKLQQSELCVA